MNRPLDVRALAARPIAALAALIALAAIVNALLVGCGGGNKSDQASSSASSSTPSSATTTPASTTPAGTTSEATGVDLGAKVYTERCVLCHGPNGKGDGPAAAGLNPKPRNHTDGAYM